MTAHSRSRNAKMVITLNENNSDAIVSMQYANGRTGEKCISAEDLVAALAQQHTMSTGILPSNSRFFKGDRNSYIIAIESPAKVRNFSLHAPASRTTRDLRIPYPICLFTFQVSRQQVGNVYVHTLHNRLGSGSDMLCYFPFGNTYDDGRVCWGGVNLPRVDNPMALAGIIASFYDASFNGDLTHNMGFTPPNNQVNNFWELVSYLDGQTSFADSMLRETRTSFDRLINNVI